MTTQLLLGFRLIVGTIFLVSAGGKFRSHASLADDVMEYDVLSRSRARIVALILPYAELGLAALCIMGVALPILGAAAAALLIAFTVGILANLRRGRRIRCHCFGSSGSTIGPLLVVRNVALMGMAVLIALIAGTLRSYDQWIIQWPQDFRVLRSPDEAIPLLAASAFALAVLFLLSEANDAVLGADGDLTPSVSKLR